MNDDLERETRPRDPVRAWAEYQNKQEAERVRETVRRKMAEARITREAQQAAALPAQLVAPEERLRSEFRQAQDRARAEFQQELLEVLRAVGATTTAVDNALARLAKRLDALGVAQGTVVANVADLVEARLRQASTLVDVTPAPASPAPHPRRPDRPHGGLN
jgi:hypothetical protein